MAVDDYSDGPGRDVNAERAAPETPVEAADLTHFQLSILGVLAEGPDYGLAIRRALEAYEGEEVNHGQMYPNLSQLAEAGYVEKRELDSRTNQYSLTDEGREMLTECVAWYSDRLEGGEE